MSIGLGGLLEERYPLPEWALIFELNKGTGFRGTVRRCDAVAFNCYPSSGHHRLAFEMKTGRGDFLKELDHPQKRKWLEENFHQVYFVATPGIVKDEEVPEGWGLLVATKAGDKLRRVKVARHRELPVLPEELALSAIRSLARRMHSFTIPFEFEGRKVTRGDIDRYVHEELALEQDRLRKKLREAETERNRVAFIKKDLIAPFMVLAEAVIEDWSVRRAIEREDPAEQVTAKRVREWLATAEKNAAKRMLEQARTAHDALGRFIELGENE